MSPVEENGPRSEAEWAAPRLISIADLDLALVFRVRADTSTKVIKDYAAHPDLLPPIRIALVDDRRVVVAGLDLGRRSVDRASDGPYSVLGAWVPLEEPAAD